MAADVSVVMELAGWPEDSVRFLASLARHGGDHRVEIVAVDRRSPPDPAIVGLVDRLVPAAGAGFGEACNLGLRAATGGVVALVDTSLELTGDLLGAMRRALADPGVAVTGPFGLATTDLCDYRERTGGDVAAVQGYCLAARRSEFVAAGGVQETFAWYRNADIDVSLRLRTLTGSVRRAVAAGSQHCSRHAHRAWEATPEPEREQLSRRNMGIVHEVFFGRDDLAVP